MAHTETLTPITRELSSGLISMCRSVPLFWRSAALYWGTDAQTAPLCVGVMVFPPALTAPARL